MRIFLGLLLLTASALAQEKEPDKHLRIICLGDLPPWKEVIKNGVRTRVEPPPGSLPPRSLLLANAGKKAHSFNNRINEFSPPLSFHPELEQLELQEQQGSQAQSWKTITPPQSSHSLVLLWRGTKDWRTPRSRSMADSVTAFPAGKIRFVNLGHLSIRVRLQENDKVFTIAPGKGLLRDIDPGENFLQVETLSASGKRFRLFHNVFEAKRGERVNAFIYKADGIKPRRPLKILLHSERAQNYEPKKKSSD